MNSVPFSKDLTATMLWNFKKKRYIQYCCFRYIKLVKNTRTINLSLFIFEKRTNLLNSNFTTVLFHIIPLWYLLIHSAKYYSIRFHLYDYITDPPPPDAVTTEINVIDDLLKKIKNSKKRHLRGKGVNYTALFSSFS